MSYTSFDFPHTHFYDDDLRELIKIIVETRKVLYDFVSLNTIKYADPIQWNITTQYPGNTVVIDPVTGTAYLSTKPVPSGVPLSNTNYWTEIFNLGQIIGNINKNLTMHNDGSSATSTFDLNPGDWVLWNDVLYKAKHHIDIGDAYVVDANIERKTVEDFFNELVEELETEIETRASEDERIELELTDLINSRVNVEAQTRASEDERIELELTDLINSRVNVEAQTRASEDERIELELTDLITSKVNVEAQARIDADALLNGRIDDTNSIIGRLADLDTTNKDSIVTAINEVNGKAAGAYDKADIRNYGGVADGVTDCTQAFADCMADNRVVYFPRYNDYPYVLSAINISGGQTVMGDEGVAITTNAATLFNITGSFVTIKNLRIAANGAVVFNLDSSYEAIQFINIDNIVAADATMFLSDVPSAPYRITNLYVNKCYSFSNASYGVHLTKAFAFIFLNNVTIHEIGVTGQVPHFLFENNEGLHLTHCEAEGGLTDGSHVQNIGFSFVNCQAIWLERCMADTVDSHGFIFQNSNYVYMVSCVASLCGGHGIGILGTSSRRYLITNCFIGGRNTMSPAPAGAHGIYNYNDEVSVDNCEILYMTGYAIANNSQGHSTRYSNITAGICNGSFYSSAGSGIVTGLISSISGDAPVWGAFNHTNNLINGVFG